MAKKKEVALKAKPLGDRVLIKPLKTEEATAGGIILPSSISDDQLKGEVASIGEGLYTQTGIKIPMTVKVGDTVLYSKFNASEVRLNDIVYQVMRESDLVMVLR